MLSPIVRFLAGFYYSFPVQLLVRQFSNHRTMVFFWLLLFLIITNNLLTEFGGPLLYLEPEYHGKVSPASLYLLGISIGLFTLAYHMTAYILDGYKFFFVALLHKPFRVFMLNNSVIPILFLTVYSIQFLRFQHENPNLSLQQSLIWLGMFYLGNATVLALGLGYFLLTNKNVLAVLGEKFVAGLQNPVKMMRRVRNAIESDTRVDSYLLTPFRWRKVPVRYQGDTRPLLRVFNQNHANSFIVILFFLLMLLTLGLLQDYPAFQIPTGATITILLSFIIMLVGAVNYWFRRIGPLVFFAVIMPLFFLNRCKTFVGSYYAYGLDYSQARVPYTLDTIKQMATQQTFQQDSLEGTRMLQNWLARYQLKYGPKAKPKLILSCHTGGGLRSATWSLTCLQAMDSALGGHLAEQLRFMSGASGGMIGASVFREMLLLGESDSTLQRDDPQHVRDISKDILNRIAFSVMANLVVPTPTFTEDGESYPRDRGYAFESQLMDNTGFFKHRRLKDYRLPEYEARVPMVVLSPAVVNDGRQLFVSAQPIGYLLRPMRLNKNYLNEISGLEFRRMFAAQGADNLHFSTAVRMNASFPYILPFIELPTDPAIELMDAGVYDNYGVLTAVKFMYAFRQWIAENTRGVVLVSIRDSQREHALASGTDQTIISRITSVFGATYNSFAESKDFQNDDVMGYARSWLKAPLDVLELQYIPAQTFEEASLNLHLTRREREDVMSSIYNKENQEMLLLLQQLAGPEEAGK